MKKLITFLLSLSIVILIACGDDEDSSNLPNGWTEAEREEFIEECLEEGSDEDQCECQFDGISAEFTSEEYENAGLEDLGTILEITLGCAF